MEVSTTTYTTHLIARSIIARHTYELQFEKPAGFSFVAGQHVLISLPINALSDANDSSRYFSLASTPDMQLLTIVIRASDSAFKRLLLNAPIGTQLLIEEPKGKLTIPEGEGFTVCIAGGIGIVPFMSMLRDISTYSTHQGEVLLVYSNQSSETAIYLDELRARAAAHKWFRLVATMTKVEGTKHENYAVGRIDAALILKHLPKVETATFLIAGAHNFVTDMQTLLTEIGVPATAIRVEEFCGYGGFCCPHCVTRYRARLA